MLGRAVLAAGDAEQAASLLEIATQHDAGDVLAWRALGVARVQRGQLDAAGDAFQHALAISSQHIQTIVDAARLAVRRGVSQVCARSRTPRRVSTARAAIRPRGPSSPGAEVALAELRAKMGESLAGARAPG